MRIFCALQVDPNYANNIALAQLNALRDVAAKIESTSHQQNTLLFWNNNTE
jgi:hypothetical protein